MLKYVILLGGLLLAGCGFQPLYVAHDDVFNQTAAIQIEPITGQEGYQAELILQKRLNPEQVKVAPKYKLTVTFHSPTYSNQSIRGDNLATLEKMSIKATYKLVNIQKNKVVIESSVDANGLYNLIKSPYATVTHQEKLYDNLIQAMADDIATHVLSYFKGVKP